MKRKVISLILAAVMILSSFSVVAFAQGTCKIKAETVNGMPGQTVTVNVTVENNPGILGLSSMSITYDSNALTLTKAENGDAFSPLNLTLPSRYNSGCVFSWYAENIQDSNIKDGTILKLTFTVNSAATEGNYAIGVSCPPGNVYDKSLNEISPTFENGSISIVSYTPGDVDGNGLINARDLILIARYIADGCKTDPEGYNVTIIEAAANVNNDTRINALDLILICRYIADGCTTDPDGYNVLLVPSTALCSHTLEHVAALAATCTVDGNVEYWHCTKCGKYFSNAGGTAEISQESTVIAAKGHTPVIDAAVPATTTSTGLTEGSHCDVCGEIVVPQIVTPILEPETASITYKFVNNDSYLASQTISNPNPSEYIIGKGLTLSNDIEVPGYTFLGWYDSFADNATQIKSISASETNSVTLYAHWTRYPYTIQFESDLVPVNDDVYTVNQSKQLPVPQLDGYIFVGWSDGDGNIIKRIPMGTVGDKIYTANWMSERNKAWTKKDIGAPIIIEDEETDTILFTYEIGQIENVPLYVIKDFGYVNSEGVSQTISKEYTVQTNTSLMEQYTKTVANSTTNTAQWSLSDGWTDSVSVSENYLQENNLTETDAKTLCTTDSSNWLVSSGSSGSTTTTTYASAQEYDLNTATDNTKTYDTHDESGSKTHKQSADLKFSSKEYAELSGKFKIAGKGVEGKGGVELNQELDIGYEGSHTTSSASKTGTESDVGNQDQTGSVKHTGTDTVSTGSWNSSRSYGGSKTVSNSESVSKTVSEKIASERGYGKTYINTGTSTNTQGTSASATDSNAYSSAVTYSTVESTTETISYSTSNTKTGYHRLVKAGTAHVFAIVGYDIKTASYFVNTYTVMDDEYHNFEDYSYDSAKYDDNQIGVISFEVPFDIEDYVLSLVGETEGLEFNRNGEVTGYSGTEQTVIIPEYHVVDNLDGSKSVIKVTGISSTAFKGNTMITGIQLSDYITDIPSSAFEGCSNLSLINMPGVVSIGESAFKDCDLKYVFLSENIEFLGDNAFENMDTFIVYTNKKNVVDGAANSGANNIVIFLANSCEELNNSKLTVGEGTHNFVLCGRGNSLNNFSIVSNAETTIISRVDIQSDKGIPITCSSSTVQLEQVDINSSGLSMIFTNENPSVYLYGESTVSSSKGNAILCKNIDVIKSDFATQNGVFSELESNGNILYCDSHSGDSLVRFVSGEYKKITEDEYNKYLNGVYTLTFDANDGSVAETSREAYFGVQTEAFPTPTRDYYTFDGWYTQDGTTPVTPESIVSNYDDITLYAHWTLNPLSDWVLASDTPEEAQVISEKWSYDLTTTTQTTSSSTPSGFTFVNNTYSDWSSTNSTTNKPTESDTLQITNSQYTPARTHTQYHYYRWIKGNYLYTYQYDSSYTFEERWFDYELPKSSLNNDEEIRYAGTDTYANRWVKADYVYNYSTDRTFTRTVTDQAAYTTYYYQTRTKYYNYQKVENGLEATTDPTGGTGISNVQHWVQYRAK